MAGATAALLIVLGFADPSALAHRGHAFGNPFHQVSLDEARKLAVDEFKLIFLYVTAPDGKAAPYLQRPAWHDWRAIDLLIRETVAVKLDSRRDAYQLRRYELDQFPVILLLNDDGSPRRQLDGNLPIEKLLDELAEDLSGNDSVARVREAVRVGGGNDPLARERLADALARRGAHAESLEAYLWCLNVGLREYRPYASARRRLLLQGFTRLAQQYPSARQALEKQQDAMEKTLREERDDANLARDLAELNRCLGQDARTLTLFDQLPPNRRARTVLFDRVLDQLIAKRRYGEVLALVEPARAFRDEVMLARRSRSRGEEPPDARPERGTRAFAVARGAAFVEALGASGKTAEARKLIDATLKFDHTPATHALLQQHTRRTANATLISYIESRTTTQPASPSQQP